MAIGIDDCKLARLESFQEIIGKEGMLQSKLHTSILDGHIEQDEMAQFNSMNRHYTTFP